MIDPVRTGPATPVAANGADRAGVRETQSQSTAGVTASPTPPRLRATVPRLLDMVADLARGGPPVDDAKIAQLRRAIADGSYAIDADALAEAILSFARKG